MGDMSAPTDSIRGWNRGWRLLAFGILIAVASLWSILYTRGPSGFSTLWIAGGLLVGFLLTSPRSGWSTLLAAALLAVLGVNLCLNGPRIEVLYLSAGSLLEAFLVAQVVASRIEDVSRLDNIARSIWTATVTTILVCGLVAVLVATLQLAHGSVQLRVLIETWWASHALGMAIFATLTIAARVEGRRLLGPRKRRRELILTLVGLAAFAWLLFSQSRVANAFLLFPPLLLCVFRHRFSGFVPATALVSIIATMRTADGEGPFMAGIEIDDVQRTFLLQSFIACACFLAFPMATVLTERRLLARRLSESERDYRLLADNARDMVVRLAADGTRLYVSPSATEMLGWSREELKGPRWDLIHPEDFERVKQALAQLFCEGGTATVTFRTRHKDGHYVWIEAKAIRIESSRPDGPPEVIYTGRDISRRKAAEQALERQARIDSLTGLANRRHFDEVIAQALARGRRHERRIALLCLDIDRFKQINDNHGHAAGDAVLCEFAKRLQGCLRETDFAARLGGDEFVVLIEDMESDNSPDVVADKLLQAMAAPMQAGAASLAIGTSIGIAISDPKLSTPDELMLRADRALYAAKAAGRGTWRKAQDFQSG